MQPRSVGDGMPWLRYFIFVGMGLVALLFLTNAYLPRAVDRAESPRSGTIRITAVRTGPEEAVTFSGNPVSYGPAPEMRVVDVTALAPATEAFAQLRIAPAVNEAVVKRKKIAKRKARPQPAAPEFDAFAARPAPGWPGPRLAGTLFGW